MTIARSLEILRLLADGVDPMTGKTLEEDHLCNYPEVIRALATAINFISTNESVSENSQVPKLEKSNFKNKKLNAGRPWTNEDLATLKQMYQNNQSMDAICQQLQRRERGVMKQLVYLGLIESEKKPSKNPVPGLERAGLPWLYDEDTRLKELYAQKQSIPEIAVEMQRSEYSIYCRMEKLELYGAEYGYPEESDLPKWSVPDQRALREMFLSGKSIEALAKHFGRSQTSIRTRLNYMNLSKETPLPTSMERE